MNTELFYMSESMSEYEDGHLFIDLVYLGLVV